MSTPSPANPEPRQDEQRAALPDWMQRYPGVERFLEQPGDVLEGVSTEVPATPQHVYTMELAAGETIRAGQRVRFDGEYAVRCHPGATPIGIALNHAEFGEPVRIRSSEVYFTH